MISQDVLLNAVKIIDAIFRNNVINLKLFREGNNKIAVDSNNSLRLDIVNFTSTKHSAII